MRKLRGLNRLTFGHLAQDIQCGNSVGLSIGRKVEDVINEGFDR